MTRREQIIELSAKIIRLRSELTTTEGELDSLLNAPSEPKTLSAMMAELSHDVGNLTDRMISALVSTPPQGLTAEQIAAAIGASDNLDSVRSGLARLAGEGRIARVSRGFYAGKEAKTM